MIRIKEYSKVTGTEKGIDYISVVDDIWFKRYYDDIGIYKIVREPRSLKEMVTDFARETVEWNCTQYVSEGTDDEIRMFWKMFSKEMKRQLGIYEEDVNNADWETHKEIINENIRDE